MKELVPTESSLIEESKNILIDILGKQMVIEKYKKDKMSVELEIKRESKELEDLKNNLKDFLEANGITKLETDIANVTVAMNPLSVEIIDESIVPEKYKKVKYEIDKKEILKDFKDTGEIIEGIKIIDSKTSLRIK